MKTALQYLGVIISVQGTNPGPASGITYTVDVNTGQVPTRMSGVKPHNKRLPDVIHTRAAEPGNAIEVFDVEGYFQFFIDEGFDYDTSCDG